MADTDNIRRLLTELTDLVIDIEEQRLFLDVDNPDRSSPVNARFTRTILRARDVAEMVASEFAVLYWEFKGSPDPRGGNHAEE
jgi:hypothetical protein